MQVKRDDMKGMAGLSHSLGLPQEDLPKGEPYSWLESAKGKGQNTSSQRELGWKISQEPGRGFRPRNPSLSNSPLSPPARKPWKGYGLNAH